LEDGKILIYPKFQGNFCASSLVGMKIAFVINTELMRVSGNLNIILKSSKIEKCI